MTTAPATARPERLGMAVIGFGWMGRVHTQAYARLLHHFPETPLRPHLVAVADDVPGRADDAVAQFGFERATTQWRSLLDDPAIDAVSITAPNFAHREIASAFAAAGKHIWVEKPVGTTAADAIAVAQAIARSDVRSTVGFNYRNAPAVRAAKELIESGAIGDVTHASFRLLGDYAADPNGAFTWRYELGKAGHGVIGDLGSHGVDLVRYLLGEITEVIADTATFVAERRLASGATVGHALSADGDLKAVENEDWSMAMMRVAGGTRVSLEVSRVAVGHQNDYGMRIQGTEGALEWDFRRMGELLVTTGAGRQDLAVARTFVGPSDGDFGSFQPGAGIAMGYDDLKVIEAQAFVRSIASGVPIGATVADAVASSLALEAIIESSVSGTWMPVATCTASASVS